MSGRSGRILFFFFSFFYLLVACNLRLEFLDDGSSALGALRVASGDVPFRDFMSVYLPGHAYVMAFLFKIFGTSLIVERIWHCLLWAGTVTMMGLIVSRAASWQAGLFSSWMALVMVGRFPHVPGPIPSALFLSFLSASLLLGSIFAGRRPFWAGAAAGACVLFRQDLGVYSILASFTVLALCHDPAMRQKGDVRRFLLGAVIAAAPLCLYLLWKAPLHELWFCLVVLPFRIYPLYAHLPYAPLQLNRLLSEMTFYYYFTPMILASSVLFIAAGWHRPRTGGSSRRFWPKIYFIILGALFLSQAKFRPDPVHLVPAFLCATVLFGWLLVSAWERRRPVVAILACLVVSGYLLGAFWTRAAFFFEKPAGMELSAPRAKGVDVFPLGEEETRLYRDYDRTIRYIRQRISPGEAIFVGSSRHDRVCFGDPLFYFLAEASSATRYQEMVRGVANTEEAQRRIVAELDSAKIRYVVLRKALDDRCTEPNASSLADGSRWLDAYFARAYHSEAIFGSDQILARNEG